MTWEEESNKRRLQPPGGFQAPGQFKKIPKFLLQ